MAFVPPELPVAAIAHQQIVVDDPQFVFATNRAVVELLLGSAVLI
jgi:hypothetical protein